MTKRKTAGPDRALAACALEDLRYAKELARLEQADAQLRKASDARLRYIEILKPYDGMRFIDIPMEVLEAADRAMNEAQAADRKWERLMQGGR